MSGENLKQILSDVQIPFLSKLKLEFNTSKISGDDIAKVLSDELSNCEAKIERGSRVAIAVGSRGISNLVEVIRCLVSEIAKYGATAFVIPCMGSHGKNAQGQFDILSHLKITKENVGCEVVSHDEVLNLGSSSDGRAVFVDKFAWECDKIIVVNRIKVHTAFRAPIESGLLKMLAVGLGKQKGADSCHSNGFEGIYNHIKHTSEYIINSGKVLLGIGLVENSQAELCKIKVIKADEIKDKEPELLNYSKSLLPSLPISEIDVLIVDEMGKNISGAGMDTNVIGRYPTEGMTGGPSVDKLTVLRLTPQSSGSAHGVGFADFTTRKLFDAIDMDMTYPNGLTNKVTAPAKIPMVLPTDKTAIQAAIHCCMKDISELKVVRIKNTHNITTIEISEAVAKELALDNTEFYELQFDAEGNLSI